MKKKCINNEIYVEINGLSIYAQLCDEEATAESSLEICWMDEVKERKFSFHKFSNPKNG